MEKQEIMKRVLLKIKSRPDIRCISEKYLAEVIDDAIYDAVSYTHLDVYKRQLRSWKRKHKRMKKSKMMDSWMQSKTQK